MIKTNINEFLRKFKANQQLALDASAKVVNGTLLEMYKRIIDRTPVGDPSLWKWPAHQDYRPGTLREGWNLSFNGQQRNSSGRFTSTNQLLGGGGLSFKVGTSSSQIAVIFNPTPYAQRVETGWSTQAPQGMMRITIAEYSSIVDQQANKYRIK